MALTPAGIQFVKKTSLILECPVISQVITKESLLYFVVLQSPRQPADRDSRQEGNKKKKKSHSDTLSEPFIHPQPAAVLPLLAQIVVVLQLILVVQMHSCSSMKKKTKKNSYGYLKTKIAISISTEKLETFLKGPTLYSISCLHFLFYSISFLFYSRRAALHV